MDKEWTCQNCGHKNPDVARVCGKCSTLRGSVGLFEDKLQKNISLAPEDELTEILLDTPDCKSEKALETIATIIRAVGIIVAIIFLFVGINLLQEDGNYVFLICIIPTLLFSETAHAFLRVICNISNNLRRLNIKK